MPFTAQSSLSALMAEPPDRSLGVLMSQSDQYASKLSVHVAIYDPVHATWTWNDITQYVRHLEWDRGATQPLEQPPVGTAQIIVDNNNGYFSPWDTTLGPFAGTSASLLTPNSCIRFGATKWDPSNHSNITWLPFFSGRIEKIEEVANDPSGADVQVMFTCVDVAASLAAHAHGVTMGGGPGAPNAWVLTPAVVLPVTITASTNDQFICNGVTYTIAAGTYSTLAAVAAAIGAATASSASPFSTVVTVAAMDLGLLLTVVATGASALTLTTGGGRDALLTLSIPTGLGFSTYIDGYYGDTGSVMVPGLLNDVGFGFGYIDGVTSVNPTDPYFTVAPLQSPERTENRLQALQQIATSCNCMVFASSSGAIIINRFGPAVTDSPNFGTFSNKPTGGHYPIQDAVIYASTDRILNEVTGQRVIITTPQLITTSLPQVVGAVNSNHTTEAVSVVRAPQVATILHDADNGTPYRLGHMSSITHTAQEHMLTTDTTNAYIHLDDAGGLQFFGSSTGVNFQATNGNISLGAHAFGTGYVFIEGEKVNPAVGNVNGNVLTRVSGVWQGSSISAASISLTNADILVGNASNVAAAVALSGDGTMTNAGVLTVKGVWGHAFKNALPTDAQLLLWNNTNADWEPVSLSGDATVTNTGVLTIGAGAVTGSKIASSAALAGSPTTTTQADKDNSTKIATTAYANRAGVFVCTSSTHPSSPFQGMTIYETDTGNLLQYQGATDTWQPPWNTPWGYIAETTWTTDTSTAAGPIDITNATLTWTAIANRRYRYTLKIHSYGSVAQTEGGIFCTDGVGTSKGDTPANFICYNGVNAAVELTPQTIVNTEHGIAAGSTTRKWRVQNVGGAATFHAYADGTYIASFLIEDIGPNGAPS